MICVLKVSKIVTMFILTMYSTWYRYEQGGVCMKLGYGSVWVWIGAGAVRRGWGEHKHLVWPCHHHHYLLIQAISLSPSPPPPPPPPPHTSHVTTTTTITLYWPHHHLLKLSTSPPCPPPHNAHHTSIDVCVASVRLKGGVDSTNLQVPMVPQVLYNTMVNTGWCAPVPVAGMVYADMGVGWNFPTHRWPMPNLIGKKLLEYIFCLF